MRFDLPDLRLFLAVVEAGSITHGASAAHRSLAAASERLREMEASGGVPLLVRGRRGVVPNRAGEALAHHARRVLREVASLHAELAEHARGLRATVRLLANTAAITEFLPERLGPWLASHPQVDVDLAERPSAGIVRSVAAGLAEIGIVSDAIDTAALETHRFALDRLVVVLPRGHRLAGAQRLDFAQILSEPQVTSAGALQQHLDEQAARLGQRLRPRVRMQTFDGVCRLVAAGVGVGVVPERAVARARKTAPLALASARLTDPWATRRLLLCYRADPPLPTIARQLLEALAGPAERAR